MRILTTFRGRNKDFQAWLTAGMPANVVCLEAYRKKKKTAQKRPKRKAVSTSIPNGVA